MRKLYLIFLIPIVLLFSGCNNEDESAAIVIKDSQSFKDLKQQSNTEYKLKTIQGKDITLTVDNGVLKSNDAELKNKMVLINFWATWCPPCVKEIPVLNRLYDDYKNDFVVIGVLYEKDKNLDELRAFMQEHNMKFPVSINGDENFRMAKNINNVKKIPESYLYGKDGKIVEKYIGLVDEESLENHIKSSIK
ncbi:thioredoxin [Arcobacter sp. CECT 8986]|uniref:TlpA family protein disulfide reductase n=1 Tax=Arcobacter sp. CECT 8986 TaxID=2044507 RepID=UPI001009C4EB|nr:TlpA disulfide reductase family protein [Arcobacter sp. CECT 8986]RXK00303.1 thioredoxin [Arcobacter sp. CECT 8986]